MHRAANPRNISSAVFKIISDAFSFTSQKGANPLDQKTLQRSTSALKRNAKRVDYEGFWRWCNTGFLEFIQRPVI
jgi:hypothetical protein